MERKQTAVLGICGGMGYRHHIFRPGMYADNRRNYLGTGLKYKKKIVRWQRNTGRLLFAIIRKKGKEKDK